MNRTTLDEKWKKYRNGDEDIKEEFCGACLAIPLAFAGVGTSLYGSSSRNKYKKQKKIALWGGIVVVVMSLAIAIYYLCSCKDCR